jgi:hypothetical protein
LDRAKQARLEAFNVFWVKLTARAFAEQVLPDVSESVSAGLDFLAREDARGSEDGKLQEVSNLRAQASHRSEFLLGEEPTWSDIAEGRAITREFDAQATQSMRDLLDRTAARKVLLVSGTAGSGKSTLLRRLALDLDGSGHRVAWVDYDLDTSPREIRRVMRGDDPPKVLIVDDADVYGNELSVIAAELLHTTNPPLMIFAIRSGRIEKIFAGHAAVSSRTFEISMPPLSDPDISALVDLLHRENRLGVLREIPRPEQEEIFRKECGRELLVAMIQATSGKKFEDKVVEELGELEERQRIAYATVAVAAAFRFSLSTNDVLVATGDTSNEMLNAVDQLVRRHLLRRRTATAEVLTRHRVIAEVILRELQRQGLLHSILPGIAIAAAGKVNSGVPRNARPWRLLKHLLNHDFLYRNVGLETSREIYDSLEASLSWDFHFWLQRGSLEVEFGSLNFAENFLGQSRSLNPHDQFVETEWAYLLFRKAIESPAAPAASTLADEALITLEQLIEARGDRDRYPFHVLGTQGLSWSRRGIPNRLERSRFLRRVLQRLEAGCLLHGHRSELQGIRDDVKREILLLTT